MASLTPETRLRYSHNLYDALAKKAEKAEDDLLVWEGKVTKLFSTLSISNAHYSDVMSTLVDSGCIVQVQRGARGVPTRIALFRRPEKADMEVVGQHLTKPSAHDKLSQRVSQLERRFEGIDLGKYIQTTERRLAALEGKKRSA